MKAIGGIFFIIFALFLSGCGGAKYNITPNTPLEQPCFNNSTKTAKNCEVVSIGELLESKKRWRIVAYSKNHSVVNLEDSLETPFFISFTKGQINGSFGCNGFFGQYFINKDSISVKNAGMTRKMCDLKTMDIEAILTKEFLNSNSLKVSVINNAKGVGKIFFINNDFYLVLY